MKIGVFSDTHKNILNLNKLCKKRDTRFLLIVSFCSVNGMPKAFFDYRDALIDTAEKNKIAYLFIKDLSELSESENSKYFLDNYHLNSLGHRRLMSELFYIVIEWAKHDLKNRLFDKVI